MKLIFEKSVPGRRCSILPRCDVEEVQLPQELGPRMPSFRRRPDELEEALPVVAGAFSKATLLRNIDRKSVV